MSNNTVTVEIKIDDKGSIKTFTTDADEMRNVIEQVKNENDKLKKSLINNNQAVQAFEKLGAAVRGLQSVMHELTDSYRVQVQAEARLEQMMRNAMDATDEEIQSIKDLAAEQQRLGVIGDEVILSGAQELATYMNKKASLEALIPLMGDMIAQQYGYNATTESAVSVAQMMGKVFAGETGSLKRLGYTFDEAQEQILKFGSEEEKVATLTEVVGQIVDGTNAKLAAAPYGKIAKFSNDLGDIKERLGEMIAPAMNAVDKISSLTIAIAGIAKGVSVIKSAVIAFKSFSIQATLAATKTALLQLHTKMLAAAQRMLAAAGYTAAAGTRALEIAVTGLYAALTLGLSVVIQALIELIMRLFNKTEEAVEGFKELDQATEAFKSASGQANAEIESEIAALKRLIDSGENADGEIRKLNERYGEIFGSHQKAADWYDILTEKSQTYCRQLGYEAKAKALAAQIGEKITERDELADRLKNTKKTFGVTDVKLFGGKYTKEYSNPIYTALKIGKKVLDKQIKDLTEEMNASFREAGNAAEILKGKNEEVATSIFWQQMNYIDLGKAVSDQEKKVESLVGVNDEEAEAEGKTLQAMQKRYEALGNKVDKLTGKVKNHGKEELERKPLEFTPELTPKEASSIPVNDSGIQESIAIQITGFRNLEEINRRIQDLQQQRLLASKDEIPVIDAQIAYVERLRDEFEGISKAKMPDIGQAWSGIKSVGSSIRSIKDAITETDNAWDALTQTVDGFISLFQSFTSIIEIIRNITAVTKALTEQKKQETAQAVEGNAEEAASELGKAGAKVAASNMAAAAKKTEATANAEAAATGAASSVASIPLVGAAMAVAAVASVIAALASLPKFASGAVVYGPTLGLMGEYAGASSNPEVIAPLSKLQGLIGGQQGRSEVKFRIEGRELVGILNKQGNINRRNG